MAIVVGIDEAGYGPLLGPLVVSASVWQVPDGGADQDLWKALRRCVRKTSKRPDWRLAIDDSKRVYDRKKGICSLERPVLAMATCAGLDCGTLLDLLAALGVDLAASARTIPWYQQLEVPLPLDPEGSAYDGICVRLRKELDAAGIRCLALCSRVVTEDAFNARVTMTRNKAAVLLEQVLRLVVHAAQRCNGEELTIFVDRLGGRGNYRSLLMEAFPDRHLHEVDASRLRSAYRLLAGNHCVRIEFLVDGDQKHLPIALASMVSKYVREALMTRFNAYWCERSPALKPTAGYYGDAQRFLQDIHPVALQVGLETQLFVRRQ